MLPLMTASLGLVISRRPPTMLQALGLTLVTAGAIGLVLSSAGGMYLSGDVLLLGASAAWSLYALLLRRSGLAPTDAAAMVVVVSAICYLPGYWVLGSPAALWDAPASHLALQVTIQGLLVGFGSVWLYSMATAALGAPRVAAVASTVPAIVAVLAVPLLAEELSWNTAASVALVVAGALIAVRYAEST
jgi:drug/metabolite transporter (DMT)-like permease